MTFSSRIDYGLNGHVFSNRVFSISSTIAMEWFVLMRYSSAETAEKLARGVRQEQGGSEEIHKIRLRRTHLVVEFRQGIQKFVADFAENTWFISREPELKTTPRAFKSHS